MLIHIPSLGGHCILPVYFGMLFGCFLLIHTPLLYLSKKKKKMNNANTLALGKNRKRLLTL